MLLFELYGRSARADGQRVRMMARVVFTSVLLLGVGVSFGDDAPLWTPVDANQLAGRAAAADTVSASEYQLWQLDRQRLQTILTAAPDEKGGVAARGAVELVLPLPDGSSQVFSVVESSIMEPALAAKFPEIKTYIVRAAGDRASHGRIDVTPHGFHAILRTSSGRVFIDPFDRANSGELYASYFTRNAIPRDAQYSCGTSQLPVPPLQPGGSVAAVTTSGDTLQTYRLACAATGEYTSLHGGTVGLGLSAIVTAINRVNMAYEADLAVRMVLVANNNQLVYTNGAADPYSNNDGFAMLGQNQGNVNAVIGSPNYDIGHVFSTGGGGVAQLRAVCGSSKAQGVTGLPSPIGDPFYIDFVAHEIGHQFGGNHTFNGVNGSCAGGNRNNSTAYEPGSGSTIMAYAGICQGDNLQNNSDPDFHSESLREMRAFVTNPFSGGSCDVPTSTGNTPPVADAGPDYTIPALTPFTLVASGFDADSDNLTFDWEQRDRGPAQAVSAADNGSSPLFRSWPATSDPSRTFPRIVDLVNNTTVIGERLPTLSRGMDFRVIVRDDRAGGGGVDTDDMVATVVSSAGPFLVTSPGTSDVLAGQATVQWDAAGTDLSPINAASVNILLSIDGGLTYPFTLATETPNDGEESVALPDVASDFARIKVEAFDNIFFNISNGNFRLLACGDIPSPLAEAVPIGKSRFLSFSPGDNGVTAALRVTLTNLPAAFAAFEGETRWVGPPQTYVDTLDPPTNIVASALQCDPYFSDWAGISELHVYGEAIVPEAVYDVQAVACDETIEANFSPPLVIATSVWADAGVPFQPDTAGTQPNVVDVTTVVDRVKQVTGASSRAFAQLQPNLLDLTRNANVTDVTMCVDAVKGDPYPLSGPVGCGG